MPPLLSDRPPEIISTDYRSAAPDNRPMKRWAFLAGVVAAFWLWSHARGGVVATTLADGALEYPGYHITALEDYTMDARVLSRRDYRDDREAALAPTDLALGWGPMADETVLADIDISQNHRWYFWRASKLPIPAREIGEHSANVHVIAASATAAKALANVKVSDRVRVVGKLVEVRADDGWRWRSSLSRTDTGASSCELLWLERLEVL
jgi:hypothetical protein